MKKNLILLSLPLLLASCGAKGKETGVKKQTHYDADGKVQMTTSFTYDKSGNLVEIYEEAENNGSLDKAKTTLIYKNDILLYDVISYFDEKTGEYNPIRYAFYSFNENNQETLMYSIMATEDGFEPSSLDLTYYDEKGRNVGFDSYMYFSSLGGLELYMSCRNTYNDKDLLITQKQYMVEEGVSYLVKTDNYEYDDKNRETKIKEYSSLDELIGYTTFTYQENQKIEIYTQVQEDESLLDKVKMIYTYDNKDRLIKDEYFYLNDERTQLVLDSYTVYEY